MGFQVSPGIVVSEIDLTTVIPSVATTDCAFAAPFQWGPVDQIITIDSENTLFNIFNGPADELSTSNNTGQAAQWMTAASFLSYGDRLHIVRVVGDFAFNAVSEGTAPQIKNIEEYENNHEDGSNSVGPFAAKYPSNTFGNSLEVAICPSASAFSNTLTVTGNVDATAATHNNSGLILNVNNDISNKIEAGEILKFPDSTTATGSYIVTAYGDSTNHPNDLGHNWVTFSPALNAGNGNLEADSAITRYWRWAHLFDSAPGTSQYCTNKGASNDECHIVVNDAGGEWSGTSNTVLERHTNLSVASDAKDENGSSIYYRDVLKTKSDYIWWMDHPSAYTTDSWGCVASTGVIFGAADGVNGIPKSYRLSNGKDHNHEDSLDSLLSARVAGYKLFDDPESTDISLIILGNAHADRLKAATLIQQCIDNVALNRLDCVVCCSPIQTDTVGQTTQYAAKDAVIATRDAINRSTSYAIMDSGHKMMYDMYNDVYRAVPLNGDIAGLAVRTDTQRDPWWSPAGLNRGHIKNVVKLYFSPRKSYRDDLYKKGINPVITIPSEGTVLYGDKTLQAKPSAFDRINVRRLFIVLEKAISRASKYTLFEFNDVFTRAQFRNMVEPFLEDVKGRRGLYDFKCVCDETNNTGEVIDRNEFIGDIYIKPARSINFISLNFIATRTGVDFSEVVGKW